ncbi:hypothetical protein BV22DRAFT_1060342 [Leucogyrophana mollusca]|uniref:Uncharacterized protein n=1 Tax=Leucogyrophana mollusca TaxID=85980 RepID=A0ACB8BPH1_9AGAM|nr:hypothetical protein BV22DRAFT_1060342 [Leucogyrophana mollusca]
MEPTVQDLPSYTPSNPAPDYSSQPLPGERCIQKSPRQSLLLHLGSSSFSFKEHKIALTLRDCREEEGLPTYGLCSSVLGEVALEQRDRVLSVTVKLEGRIHINDSLSPLTTVLFSKERNLWKRGPSSDEPCPGMMPVCVPFPSTYHDRSMGQEYRLPPSYELSSPRKASIIYTLTVTVSKAKVIPIFGRKVTRETLIAQLRYHPRVRPPRPVPSYSMQSKQCPEEWREEIWATKGSIISTAEPLLAICQFYLPSVRVFTITDTIPFHLRLKASPHILEALMHAITPTRRDDATYLNFPIHVYLLRQTVVDLQGTRVTNERVLGTGSMTLQSSTPAEDASSEDHTLTWDGTVCCKTTVTHTGFITNEISVKDFIVVSLLAPPTVSTQDSHVQLRHPIPIRLVTEPWIDRS